MEYAKAPSLTNHKPYISKTKLIKSSPVNRWFTVESSNLDIARALFDRRVKKLPVEHRVIGKSNQFRVSATRKAALLSGFVIKKKPAMTESKLAIKKNADFELSLFNLTMLA